jgi:lipoprotein-anchoring transpeptidase ErfK/SrfK
MLRTHAVSKLSAFFGRSPRRLGREEMLPAARWVVGLVVIFLTAFAGPAVGGVRASIDLSAQAMTVTVDGLHYATWRVSTARSGYHTPIGSFRPYLLKRMHYSSRYENSPMPYSVFFHGGYAIHGTGYLKSLGRPVSHGCVRLHPRNAALLYRLVRNHGMGSTRIVIHR